MQRLSSDSMSDYDEEGEAGEEALLRMARQELTDCEGGEAGEDAT
jgi:hypothetical protein